MTGGYIEFEKLGYKSLNKFIEHNPDVAKVDISPSGSHICVGVASSDTAHLSQLIQRQKSTKKSHRKGFRKTLKIRKMLYHLMIFILETNFNYLGI